jgi:hypothetical protein
MQLEGGAHRKLPAGRVYVLTRAVYQTSYEHAIYAQPRAPPPPSPMGPQQPATIHQPADSNPLPRVVPCASWSPQHGEGAKSAQGQSAVMGSGQLEVRTAPAQLCLYPIMGMSPSVTHMCQVTTVTQVSPPTHLPRHQRCHPGWRRCQRHPWRRPSPCPQQQQRRQRPCWRRGGHPWQRHGPGG